MVRGDRQVGWRGVVVGGGGTRPRLDQLQWGRTGSDRGEEVSGSHCLWDRLGKHGTAQHSTAQHSTAGSPLPKLGANRWLATRAAPSPNWGAGSGSQQPPPPPRKKTAGGHLW